jgi:hypothetical protein
MMIRYLFLSVMALIGLLLLVACQPAATPEGAASRMPPAEVTDTPAAGATATPPPEPSPTAEPTTPLPTPTSEDSPLPTPIPTPTSEVSPLPTPVPEASADGNADVLHVRAVQDDDGTWTFHVTVEHPDTGWEDYADGWDVLTPGDQVIRPDPDSPFTRLLLHPHVDEQPFTRSQGGIVIPPDLTQVRVRAHDMVDGYGGREVIVDLTAASGPDFEVERRR